MVSVCERERECVCMCEREVESEPSLFPTLPIPDIEVKVVFGNKCPRHFSVLT